MAGEHILVVDDERLIRMSLADELTAQGFEVSEAETGKEALAAFDRNAADLVLLDYRLPDIDGLAVLQELMQRGSEVPVILMTAYSSIETAIEAIRKGAYDYVNKPFDMDELLIRIRKALETTELRREVWRYTTNQREAHGLGRLLGRSQVMQELRAQAERLITSSRATVLIRGESGTGKDVLARALHYESERARAPFVNVTCTAIPDHLLESELFGHERGAFTDARTQKQGLLEKASKGTVFLDEIGDMSVALQAKLLRFLEDRTLRRVGGTQDITVDVRVIAATNKDLEKAVEDGTFRPDLYYRLKVIQIESPPLRAREGDVALLADAFAREFSKELRRPIRGIGREALAALTAYPWPGNIRELKNAIERAAILGRSEWIELGDLPPEVTHAQGGAAAAAGASEAAAAPAAPAASGASDPAEPTGEAAPAPAAAPAEATGANRGWLYFELPPQGIAWEELEDDLVKQALERTNGNQSSAARLLGLSRDQLRYRMERIGLLPPSKQRLRRMGQPSGK